MQKVRSYVHPHAMRSVPLWHKDDPPSLLRALQIRRRKRRKEDHWLVCLGESTKSPTCTSSLVQGLHSALTSLNLFNSIRHPSLPVAPRVYRPPLPQSILILWRPRPCRSEFRNHSVGKKEEVDSYADGVNSG